VTWKRRSPAAHRRRRRREERRLAADRAFVRWYQHFDRIVHPSPWPSERYRAVLAQVTRARKTGQANATRVSLQDATTHPRSFDRAAFVAHFMGLR
jgi:hypothetical protein